MDRATLLKQFAQAERHAADGRRHLARQEELIARLDQHGHDTTEALNVLSILRTTQALHEADVERILGELGQ